MKKTKAEAMLEAAFKKLPGRMKCPKCGRSLAKEQFGLRVTKKDARGQPVTISRQSYCSECRSARV